MEDDEWMKLAVEDKIVHKLWKARVSSVTTRSKR